MPEAKHRPAEHAATDFVREKVKSDLAAGKHGGRVATRFPPEPNGYLHIGHAKSICLNFGIATEFGGVCHLRMDDTNPATEDPEYVEAIQRDVRWLGFEWGANMFYASDYYDRLYELACALISFGKAYVCDLSDEEISRGRGAVGEPGVDSPYRTRSVRENLDRFERMRAGEFPAGACVLRAKIDMASPNMKMRDPAIYRIKHAHHYRTKDAWCIYPLYDFAHCLSDSFERITHSICTMEFESARELYDWVIENTRVPWVPKQTEFARLNLSYTVMSKRKLLALVESKLVSGWDDPRMPTLAGFRRRGVTPEAIRDFCGRIGVAKNLSVVDLALLEHTIREDLNTRAPRVLGVLRPLRLVLENVEEGHVEEFDAPYWPHDVPKEGSRKLPFSRVVYIDREDFLEAPPKDFHRLAPGRSVRLRHAYIVTCTGVAKDEAGEVTEVRATIDPETRGGQAPPGKKVDGTIQWVSAAHALDACARLYDRLFIAEDPGSPGTPRTPGSGERDFKDDLNPSSLVTVTAKVEPSLASAKPGERFQLERVGFFIVDPDSRAGELVLNRTVSLKDSWAKSVARDSGIAPPPKGRERPSRSDGAGSDNLLEHPRQRGSENLLELTPEARALAEAHALAGPLARTLSMEPALHRLFLDAVGRGANARGAATLLANEVLGEMRANKLIEPPFDGAALAELLSLAASGALSSNLVKAVLGGMFQGEGSPSAIAEKRGLRQAHDEGALAAAIERVLAANEDAVRRYRAGNVNVLGALVGLAMKESGGKANPKLLSEQLRRRLGA